MNNINFKNIAEELIDTFLNAGKIAKEISRTGIKITLKTDKTPVTNADMAVNKLLTEKIKKLTPNIPIISEETVNLEEKNNPIEGEVYISVERVSENAHIYKQNLHNPNRKGLLKNQYYIFYILI